MLIKIILVEKFGHGYFIQTNQIKIKVSNVLMRKE